MEPLYHSFVYSPTTSFQYLSIPCNAFIACTIMSEIFNRHLTKGKCHGSLKLALILKLNHYETRKQSLLKINWENNIVS